jgi:Protein of unknown function (DUF2384)
MDQILSDLRDERMAGLRIVNNEGEDVEFGRSEYEVKDEASLLAVLRKVEELREDPPAAGKHGFSWLQPMGDIVRPLGHLEIGSGNLLLEVQSRTRLQTLRGLVESRAGDLVRHLGDSHQSVQDIVRDLPNRPPQPPPAAPTEGEREALLAWKTAHYKSWPDDPLPALGGKTARQAIRTPKGRDAVRNLLRTMEHSEEKEKKQSLPAYDFNILRRELGLDEE